MEDRFETVRRDFTRKLQQLEQHPDGADADLGPTRRVMESYRAARDRLRDRWS